MTEEEIREGDIAEIDYIAEFTKEHINEGKALVIWKGNNQQPLVRKLDTKTTIWTCYEHIAKVVGHIDIEGYMDKALKQEDILDKIRAEIQGLRNCSCSCSDGIIDDVEDIIDKYKAESEE